MELWGEKQKLARDRLKHWKQLLERNTRFSAISLRVILALFAADLCWSNRRWMVTIEEFILCSIEARYCSSFKLLHAAVGVLRVFIIFSSFVPLILIKRTWNWLLNFNTMFRRKRFHSSALKHLHFSSARDCDEITKEAGSMKNTINTN